MPLHPPQGREPLPDQTPNAEVVPRGTGTLLASAIALLLIAGGLNWGLVGLFGIDLVARLLGEGSLAARVVYALIGLAAVLGALLAWQARRYRPRPGLR